MDQIVTELLKLGLPGIVIFGLSWGLIKLFGRYEEKGREQRDDAKTSEERERKWQAIIAELTPVLRDHTALATEVRELLRDIRDHGTARRR